LYRVAQVSAVCALLVDAAAAGLPQAMTTLGI
jgi:hypothetical protein